MLLNSYLSLKKKIRKIQMIFDIENSLRKSNFGTFLKRLQSSAKQPGKLLIGEDVEARPNTPPEIGP